MTNLIPIRQNLIERFEKGLSSPEAAVRLIQELYPTADRLKHAFREEYGEICERLGRGYAEMRPANPHDTQAWLKLLSINLRRNDVRAYGARGDEIAVGDPLTYAREFPSAAQAVAATYLRPDVYFFEVVCKEPTASSGTRLHLIFVDPEGWCMAGPVWRLLRE